MAIVERPETASLIDFEQPDTTAVLEALPIMVSYFDRDLRYRYVNRRYLDVYSCSHNAIIGKRMPDLIGPEIFEQVRPYIEKALRGEVVRHNQRLTVGALDERDFFVTHVPHHLPGGAVAGVYNLIVDQTEHPRADERFRMLAENLYDILWDWNLASGEMWRSRADLEHDRGADEHVVDWWRRNIHPEDRERVSATTRAALASARSWRVSYRFNGSDGRYAHRLDRAMIVRDIGGTPTRIVGVTSDVTASHRREQLMAEKRRLLEMVSKGTSLQMMLDELTTVMLRLALEPCHVLITRVQNGMLRPASSASLPPSYVDALDPIPIGPHSSPCGRAAWYKMPVVVEDIERETASATFKALSLEHGLRSCFSVPVLDSEGSVIATFALLYPRPNRNDKDDLEAVNQLARTAALALERINESEALQRQSEVTRTVTDNAATCLFLIDDAGRATYMNETARVATRHRFETIKTKHIHEVLHPWCSETTCLLAVATTSGKPLRDFETRIERRDGSTFAALCHYTPLHHNEHRTGAVLEARDLTEHHALRDLREKNRQLNELNALKSEFVSTMSHELRTPLNSIIGFTDVLLAEMSGPLNEAQKKQLTFVSDAGSALLKLISEILDLSRIEAGKSVLDTTRFDVTLCLSTWVDSLQPAAQKKGIALRVEGIETPCLLTTDENRLRQIVLNLVSNAVKFTREGAVLVSLERLAETVTIRISDTGPGIAPEAARSLFQAFTRVGADTPNEGVGLGLHISRKLAVLLGGSIELASEPGEGTTLSVTLPRTLPEDS